MQKAVVPSLLLLALLLLLLILEISVTETFQNYIKLKNIGDSVMAFVFSDFSDT